MKNEIRICEGCGNSSMLEVTYSQGQRDNRTVLYPNSIRWYCLECGKYSYLGSENFSLALAAAYKFSGRINDGIRETPPKADDSDTKCPLTPGYYWWKTPGDSFWSGILQIYGIPPFCGWTVYKRGVGENHGNIASSGSFGEPHNHGMDIEIGPRIEETI